jgi:hypothetical protein
MFLLILLAKVPLEWMYGMDNLIPFGRKNTPPSPVQKKGAIEVRFTSMSELNRLASLILDDEK